MGFDPEESSRSSGVDGDSLSVPPVVFSVGRGGTVDDDRRPSVGDSVVSGGIEDTGVPMERQRGQRRQRRQARSPMLLGPASSDTTAPHQLSLTDDFSHRTSNSPAPQQRHHSTASAH